jgi:hypothetical protein
MRMIARLFIDNKLVLCDEVEASLEDFEFIIPAYANKHAAAIGTAPLYMVEFEFPDLPEPIRYMRTGTDTRRMVDPVCVAAAVDRMQQLRGRHRDN